MRLAVCILARNEAQSIGPFIASLARQTVFADASIEPVVYVGANGCSDATVAEADKSARSALAPLGVAYHILDFADPGKSRSWNRMVHHELDDRFDMIGFVDADIVFIDAHVLAAAVAALSGDPGIQVYSGYPIKHIARNPSPGALDRLSLSASRHTRYVDSINGSLYFGRASCLKAIWLPDETPGEDGFLNAMVDTNGFTRSGASGAIAQSSSPTHYFQAPRLRDFFAHERRMIVGTVINCWIFEYLWAQKLSAPAGPTIARLNAEQPHWVEDLIAERVRGRRWVVPAKHVTRRLHGAGGGGVIARAARLPVMLSATMLTIPPALMANRALKTRGSASLW